MKRSLWTVVCVLVAAGLANAQTPPVVLTLPEAIAWGLEASHRIAEMVAREDSARAVETQRESATRPQSTVTASYTRTNHVDPFVVASVVGGVQVVYPDIPNVMRSRIDLQWPIYTGGRLQALTRAAGAEADATSQDREAGRADLRLEITRAYWAVITAQASQNVVRQALERTDAHLADVRNQLSVGLVPPSDVLSIEAQQARQRMLLIEADNILETSSAEFRRLTGLEADTPFELRTDPSPVTATPVVAPAYGALVAEAHLNRPERKALKLRIDAAAERVTAASSGKLPVISTAGGYDLARPNTRFFPLEDKWRTSWDLGVNVRWPLFDGGRTQAEAAEAVANRRAIESRLKEFDSQIDVEIRQRATDVRSAQASVEAARAGVQAASEARRVLAERFGAGVATNTDVLTAQVALLQAELDLTRAIANAHLAAARLDRAMGR